MNTNSHESFVNIRRIRVIRGYSFLKRMLNG